MTECAVIPATPCAGVIGVDGRQRHPCRPALAGWLDRLEALE